MPKSAATADDLRAIHDLIIEQHSLLAAVIRHATLEGGPRDFILRFAPGDNFYAEYARQAFDGLWQAAWLALNARAFYLACGDQILASCADCEYMAALEAEWFKCAEDATPEGDRA